MTKRIAELWAFPLLLLLCAAHGFRAVTDIHALMLRSLRPVLLICLLLAGGCSTQVTVQETAIPEPLIAALPLSVGAKYPEVFDNFVHEEQVIGKDKWTINLGKANRLLFDKLFSSMFTEYQVIGAAENPNDYGFDAFIEPSIDAFEFSIPEQSQTDSFAVWIRYRIKVFDKAGTQIANWPISAYGKSMTTTFGGDQALSQAALLAMRDAAALIIMQMDKSTGISSLANLNTSTGPERPPALQTTVEEMSDDSG